MESTTCRGGIDFSQSRCLASAFFKWFHCSSKAVDLYIYVWLIKVLLESFRFNCRKLSVRLLLKRVPSTICHPRLVFIIGRK